MVTNTAASIFRHKAPDWLMAKEQEDPPTGKYPEFGMLVRDIMGDMSLRTAMRIAGISHSTLAGMKQGDPVSRGLIIQFAEAFEVDPNQLLKAVGEKPLKLIITQTSESKTAVALQTANRIAKQQGERGVAASTGDSAKELTYAFDPEYAPIIEGLNDVPASARPEAIRAATDVIGSIKRLLGSEGVIGAGDKEGRYGSEQLERDRQRVRKVAPPEDEDDE